MKQILKSVKLKDEVVDVHVEDKIIVDIQPPHKSRNDDDAQIHGLTGARIFPGFIDLQINGGLGQDFVTDPGSIWALAKLLPMTGVTSFLPTLVTTTDEKLEQAITTLERSCTFKNQCARPLGIHAEGPFLSPSKVGAHNLDLLRRVEDRPVWLDSPHLKMITLAPELQGAPDLIEELAARGVLVAVGHSDAKASDVESAADLGLCYGTHLFNAMSGLHHRAPGVAAALLADERLTCGLIVDGIHVDPLMVRLAWQLKGKEGINLVTDAVAAAGLETGNFKLGEMKITLTEGAVHLQDGTLAGSALRMNEALRNLVSMTGCSWDDAVYTVTATPARLLGLTEPRIAVGAEATLTCLTTDGEVILTMIEGQQVADAIGPA